MPQACPPEEEIRKTILEHEKSLLKNFTGERRLAVMELARAMDYHWVQGHRRRTKNEDFKEFVDLIEFGINKSLTLFMDKSSQEPQFPLMRSTEESQHWADSVLVSCGRLGRCEQLLEMCRVGLGEIRHEAPSRYRFRYTADPIGLEALEKQDADWYQGAVELFQRKQLQKLQSERQRISALMRSIVEPWNDHYIQYGAHPEVDNFYLDSGVLYAQRLFGQDSFSGDITFGGLPFNLFRKVLGLLIGWSLRHVDFCALLLDKKPSLSPRNLLTVPQDFEVMSSDISSFLEEDEEAVKQVMDILTLSIRNKDVYCAVPGNFVAPAFVQGGIDRLIRPVWGCLSHPFQTLLDGLRAQYRSDWDRGVDRRESHFREELYELFPHPRFARPATSVNIKRGGLIITDIDATLLDRKSGTMGLFQLKWQDTFRHSLRARESKKSNFQSTANQWVTRVGEWLTDRSPKEAACDLGLNQHDSHLVDKILLFVIGRHATHFSGPGTLDPRAAWGTWYKLLRIMAEGRKNVDPLLSLFDLLKAASPLRQEIYIEEAELRFGKVTIILDGVERSSQATD